MKVYKKLFNETKITLPAIGDEIRIGKFLNKKVIIKGYTTDKNNQPQVVTSSGNIPLFKFRISKLMPKDDKN